MPASWLHSRLHRLFVPAAALNSFLCTGLSCYSRWVSRQCGGGRRRDRSQLEAPDTLEAAMVYLRLGLLTDMRNSGPAY